MQRFTCLLLLVLFVGTSAQDSYCPQWLKQCGLACYRDTEYCCTNGELSPGPCDDSQFCPAPLQRCGFACYKPGDYCCSNGWLTDPPCDGAQPTPTTAAPAPKTSSVTPAPQTSSAADPAPATSAPPTQAPAGYCPTWYSTCGLACYKPEEYCCTSGFLTKGPCSNGSPSSTTSSITPTTKPDTSPYCPSWYSTCGQACYLPSDYNCNNGVLVAKAATSPPPASTGGSNNANNACLAKRLEDVKAGKVPARGANLGSWFIQEGWMVGWLWDQNGCNQGQYPGTTLLEKCLGNRAASVMKKHWDTFITEDDFKIMAGYNLNHVRLPVGWWNIYDTQGGASKGLKQTVTPNNYLVGTLDYIDKAFDWGEKWGIAILLDIHAAPGSQNGNDHSAAPEPGKVLWTQYAANQAQTADSVELYLQRYGSRKGLLGICLMNEPLGDTQLYKNYYMEAYKRVRKYSKDAVVVISPLISNQNIDADEWVNFMNEPQYTNVWMSAHWYHIWGFEGKSDDWKLNYIRNDRAWQVQNFLNRNPKKGIIDEWSNGGISDGKAAMQAQIAQFNKMDGGWSFWAWSKTNGGNYWSLRAAFENGWITKDQTGVAQC